MRDIGRKMGGGLAIESEMEKGREIERGREGLGGRKGGREGEREGERERGRGGEGEIQLVRERGDCWAQLVCLDGLNLRG